jgi:hypothetical protein
VERANGPLALVDCQTVYEVAFGLAVQVNVAVVPVVLEVPSPVGAVNAPVVELVVVITVVDPLVGVPVAIASVFDGGLGLPSESIAVTWT